MRLLLKFTIFLSLSLSSHLFSQDDTTEEVVVISSKYPVALSEVIGSVNVVNFEDIEKRQVTDLKDLLETTPGVTVSRDFNSGRTFNDGISIRGMGGQRVNFLVDGIRVGEVYVGYGRDLVDTSLLKRVEILKGPSSALYGSDGLAGVVSYLTKDASDLAEIGQNYFELSGGIDSDNFQKRISALGAVVGETSEAIFQYTNRTMKEMNLHDEAKVDPNPFNGEQDSFFGKFKFLLSDMVDLVLTLDSQNWSGDLSLNSELGMGGFPIMYLTTSSLGQDEGSRDRLSFTVNFSENSAAYDNGSFTFYTQKTDQTQVTTTNKSITGEMITGAGGPPSFVPNIPPLPVVENKDYRFEQSIKGFSFQMFKSVKANVRHNIVYGATLETIYISRPRFRDERNLLTGAINNNIGGELYPNKTFPDSDTIRSAIFFSDRMDIDPSLSIVFGARIEGYKLETYPDKLFENVNPFGYDLVDQQDARSSFKFGLIKDFAGDNSFYYQYAQGFRSPDFYDSNLSFTNFAQRYTIIPNADLESETSYGHEIGFRGEVNQSNWSVAWFQNNYEDFIDFVMTGVSRTGLLQFEAQNKDAVELKGIEFSINSEISETFSTTFSINSLEGIEDGKDKKNIEPDSVQFGVNWNALDDKWSIAANAKYSVGSPSDLPPIVSRSGEASPAFSIPGETIVNLFITRKVNENFSLRAAVRNLGDVKYHDWVNVAGSADVTDNDYVLNPGINGSLTFVYKF